MNVGGMLLQETSYIYIYFFFLIYCSNPSDMTVLPLRQVLYNIHNIEA